MSESVISLFDASVKQFDKRPAIQYFCPKKNLWTIKNWQELSGCVGKLANALKTLGLNTSDRVALLSATRPEWVISDIAIMKAHGIVVPIYQSSLSDQVAYILSDSESKIILVENETQLKKVRQVEESLGLLRKIIVFDPINTALKDNEIYLDDFISGHSSQCSDDERNPHDIASLVYTSGTTGEPKGAMISHDNLLYEAQVIEKLGLLSNEDVQLIFLPLAHIFARVLELSWIRTGHLLAFAESVDKLVDNMAIIKPTFMAGVPRIFEKIRAKTMETALASKGVRRLIIKAAFKEADRLSTGTTSKLKLFLAEKVVFDKIGKELKEKFGGRLRFFVSGGAALPPEVFTFFQLCDILLCEGYGLTETTAATCLNLPWAFKNGSVGRPMPGMDVRLSDDREILVRGRGVFLGFWKKEGETTDVLDKDGWFHTGDIGEIDQDGFVKIVDRKRDIIVTSQGKNIAPQRVENLIKSKSSIISHVVVVGDKKPYLTALIALERPNALAFLSQSQANNRNLSMIELSANPAIYQEVKNAIALANASLASFEQIKRFRILDREFEVGKQLTPTLKVKRKACIEEFQKEIRVLYA